MNAVNRYGIDTPQVPREEVSISLHFEPRSSSPCDRINTMNRQYALRQDSYWFKEEWDFLDEAVKDQVIQAWIAKQDYDKARGVLVARFREKFTGPVEGESDADFKKRLRGTSKQRKDVVSRRSKETLEAWDKRMRSLPEVRQASILPTSTSMLTLTWQAIQEWLKNWRTRTKRQGVKKWTPPPMPVPLKCKPRLTTAFEAFSKSANTPQGSMYVTTEGRPRCDIKALGAARKAAWEKLSEEDQQQYIQVARDMDTAKGVLQPSSTEGVADKVEPHAVA